MNHAPGATFTVLPPVLRMSHRDHSKQRSADRFYLIAIIGYALLTAGFIGYFVWRLVS